MLPAVHTNLCGFLAHDLGLLYFTGLLARSNQYFLSDILGSGVPIYPVVCLFGILDDETWPHNRRILLREILFFARETIALRWMDGRSPHLNIWRNLVNKAMLYERLVYVHRRCPSKFAKVWDPGRLSPLTSQPDDGAGVAEE